MPKKWKNFEIFQQEPLLKVFPLESEEELDKYFVELSNSDLRREIFNLKESEVELKSIFGRIFLILGEYKVGKTSLRYYIQYLLKKSFKVLSVDVNVNNIDGLVDPEDVRKDLFLQWYRKLSQELGKKPANLNNSYEYLSEIISLYKLAFESNQFEYGILVLDQANKLETKEQVQPFKVFCENFQGIWEQNFEHSLRNKILILCIGNRVWVNIFNLQDSSSFGVFSDWFVYGDEWTKATLKIALERRIRHALKPEYSDLLDKIVSDKLVNKLGKNVDYKIDIWLKTFRKYLLEFNEQFKAYNEDFTNFDKFLDEEYFFKKDFDSLKEKHHVIQLFQTISSLPTDLGREKFDMLISFIEMMITRGTFKKSNLKGFLQKEYPDLSYELIVEDLSLGPKGEKPELYKNPPFRITNDHQSIVLRPNLIDFFVEIENRFRKQPHDYIYAYLNVTAKKKTYKNHYKDKEAELLKEIKIPLANFKHLAEQKAQPNLAKMVQDLHNILLEKIIPTWIQSQENEEPDSRNQQLIELKVLIKKLLNDIYSFPLKLYGLPDSPKKEFFQLFITNVGSPGDQFQWEFFETINVQTPDGIHEIISKMNHFFRSLNYHITQLDSCKGYEQAKVINSITKSFRKDILWVVDAPNQHNFDLMAAEKFIQREINRKPNEILIRWAIFPEAYANSADRYHKIYQKFVQQGHFTRKSPPNKNKKTDIDAFLISEIYQYINVHNIRILIISSADREILRVIKDIWKNYSGIEIYIFIDDYNSISHRYFENEIGYEEFRDMTRYFSLLHKKINSKVYQGTIFWRKNFIDKLKREESIRINYAVNGISSTKMFFDRNIAPSLKEKLESLPNGTYKIHFTQTKRKNIVEVQDMEKYSRM